VKPAVDFSGIDYTDLDIGSYAVTATNQITGCVSPPAIAPVADKRVIPQFTFETLSSYCSDTGKPKGIGYIQMNVTNATDVFVQDVQWFDNITNVNVGSGVQVFELFPGFYRAEAVSTEGCTNKGIAEVKTEISPYNGVSSNGDSQNDAFIVDCITNFPNNNVKIFNRSGTKVYEIDGYNNTDRSFKGYGEEGVYISGKNLPVGTYFYVIDKRDGSKPVAGYLELER
jgi:gliding motility-associated-like protein